MHEWINYILYPIDAVQIKKKGASALKCIGNHWEYYNLA